MLDIAAVTGAEMGTACLSQADLCKIFDANTPGRGSSFQWNDILPQAAGTPVRVIVRMDSSGSTNVMRDQLIGMCGAGFTMVNPNTPGVLAAVGTSGVVNLARATQNSITYAACGQPESPPASATDFTSFRQIAVSNRRNTCVLCQQCTATRKTRCGVYSKFNIQPRICDWSGVFPNGDKDADNDAVIDLDNDQVRCTHFCVGVYCLEEKLMLYQLSSCFEKHYTLPRTIDYSSLINILMSSRQI